MKKSYLMLLLVAMFALVACNYNESEVVVGTTQTNEDAIVDGKVPLTRAISNADFVFRNTEELGNKTRKIKSVDVLKRANANSRVTRTSSLDEQDALAYVVNYDNNEGFAILAATTKLPPVISIGDEGNFNTEGFVNFIQNNGATRSGEEINPAQEVQYAVINNSLMLPSVDIGGPKVEGVDTTIMFRCLPLAKTKWGQGEPYNYYAPADPNDSNLKSVAGCVPVAAAQTLASLCYHHNWRPTTQLSETYTVNWYKINRMIFNDVFGFTDQDQSSDALAVASLIRAIGEDINVSYGADASGSNNYKLKSTYEKLGLTNVNFGNETDEIPVTQDDIFSMIINKNYPVTTQAKLQNSNQGHSFVLDGWLRLEYSVETFEQTDLSGSRPLIIPDNIQHNFDLVHVNFGWKGKCDGYYLPEAFDLTEDKYKEYIEEGDIIHYENLILNVNTQYLIYDL